MRASLQFVRVGYGNKTLEPTRRKVVKNMRRLLFDVWGLHRPNLVITVTGGAMNFQVDKVLKKRFKHGLIRAAQNTGIQYDTDLTYILISYKKRCLRV